MKNKVLFTILIIVIIAGAVFVLLKKREAPPVGPEENETEIINLLKSLKQQTGIDFSEIQPVEFKWVIKVDPKVEEVNIQGKGFEAKRISSEQFDNIDSFFMDNGFKINIYNMTAGTISGLTGYKKDQIVCTVVGGAAGYKEAEGQPASPDASQGGWIPPEPDRKDVEVKCGQLE